MMLPNGKITSSKGLKIMEGILILLFILIEQISVSPSFPQQKKWVGEFSPNNFVLLWLMTRMCFVNHKRSLEVTKCWDKWTVFRVCWLDAHILKTYDPSFTSCVELNQEKEGLQRSNPHSNTRVSIFVKWVIFNDLPTTTCIIEVVKRSISSMLFSSFANVLMNSVHS